MFLHRLHGRCTPHAEYAFLHGPHADDTFAVPPTLFTPLPFPVVSGRLSPGETVPLEEEASPVRCWVFWAGSHEPESTELRYDPGPDMKGMAVTDFDGIDGRDLPYGCCNG